MMKMTSKAARLRAFLTGFRRHERGSISVETALISTFLLSLGIGAIDFGLALERKMDMANAVRAGMQYALVRKPVQGDMTAIEAAVTSALVNGISSSGTELSSEIYCGCPDGATMDCLGTGDEDLHCSDGSQRAAYIILTLTEDYGLMWTYPGFGNSLSITETVSVRLN